MPFYRPFNQLSSQLPYRSEVYGFEEPVNRIRCARGELWLLGMVHGLICVVER